MKPLHLAVLGLLLTPLPTAAEILRGEVVGVSDGDTITVLTGGNRPVRIRLAEVDAPELHGQPFGRAAKTALSSLVYRRQATVDVRTVDRYGRAVAVVRVDGVNVNATMVEKGLAWAYLRYQTDPLYSRLQAVAQQRGLGLWRVSSPAPVPPWLFRQTANGDRSRFGPS